MIRGVAPVAMGVAPLVADAYTPGAGVRARRRA
jgi:hypothetical protein